MARYALPPTETEKYDYVRGSQHRWFFVAHAIAFVGIAVSLYGFSRMTYWTLLFLIPLAVYAAETLVGLRTSTYRRRISLTDHQAVVELWRPERHPSVDVFLPTAGEGVDLLVNTYSYVAALEYPGELSVHVLDDVGRAEVADLAQHYGFGYLARPGSDFKKAGNLEWARQRTRADHIFILDADFVPRPDALSELVPYLDDERVGIVQSPQHFATPITMGWLERAAGATQELFYRFIQPSRDAVDGAICVGTSALYRRAALESIGGFPQISHSEDVYTGFDMLKAGYRTQYVPVVLTQGICPAEVEPYISQQYRWCEGSMALLAGRDFHLHPAITARQRLAFWSGFTYYFTTALNVFFAPVPALVMIWLFPEYVAPENFVPLLGLLALWLVAYPGVMRSTWRLDVLRAQTIYGFTHAVAIYDTFFGRTAEWVPSHGEAKATPLVRKVGTLMTVYLSTTSTAVLVGLAYRLPQEAYDLAGWWALIAFVGINCYVVVPVVVTTVSAMKGGRAAAVLPAPRPVLAGLGGPRPAVGAARESQAS